ncbi:flagellar basal-body MS-ring/collar protein FliF [Lysobacter auxotrophicus]|uniref:Flagellar M-ring protein n=1 Tax=Lysobacter auxotrophicus TaxID=2992573 RepID=A0ABN6UNJ1_9GAMM|nr:flagellar basal-body MS-ring/collar protein FliF [Lysobacter auxotrophicus]BDU17851.1 flagellar M-ring protein FliF [Lysobacter auxotrophicus]
MAVITLPNQSKLRELRGLQDIPVVRQLGLFALVAAVIALGLWMFFWTQKPDYVPVFAGLDPKSTSEASELLTTAQIPFRIDPGSGALAVPQDQLGNAKLALAAAGLPAKTDSGFDAIKGDQGFGTSQFIENARYQHALEAELARTIANLRPVREARVHLAMPKPSAFTRQKEPASASVVLQLHSGAALEQGQVDAIVHLVASSIPGLPPERVTVVDQYGRMLSNVDPDSDAAISAKQFDQQHRLEATYVQRIHELLEPMTGNGRVSAQVSVDMDFAQTEEAREVYGPQQPMIRSEQLSESSAGGNNAPQGVPGSASNTLAAAPPANAAPNANASNAAAVAQQQQQAAPNGPSSRSSVRNYEIDRTLTHTRQGPGRVRRVTAAVLVDNVPAAIGKDGKPSLRSLNDAELKRIESLVQQAIGFDTQRGDAVSVVNAPFARDIAALGEEDKAPLWEHPRAMEFLRIVVGGLAVLALILFVLRPMFRQLMGARPEQKKNRKALAEATVVPVEDEEISVALSAPAQDAPPPALPPGTMSFDDKLEVARAAVSNDSKRVAQVVREWVESDA